MTHFAQVKNGIVQLVIVADQNYINTLPDKLDWVETDINTRHGIHYDSVTGEPDGKPPFRGNYAFIGGAYDHNNDVFYPKRPVDRNGIVCESWNIYAPNWKWVPPIPQPIDQLNDYLWDEPTKTWIKVNV